MRYFLLCILAASNLLTYAQNTPQAVNYQAVLRDDAGEPLNSEAVSIQIEITDALDGGTVYWLEQHDLVTSEFGSISTKIGEGERISGSSADFKDLPWYLGNLHYHVYVQAASESAFTLIGSAAFASVPYALYAETSGTGGLNTIHHGNGTPIDTIGTSGDFYIDLDNYIMFGPKTGAGWPSSGEPLIQGNFDLVGQTGSIPWYNGFQWIDANYIKTDGARLGIGVPSLSGVLSIYPSTNDEINFQGSEDVQITSAGQQQFASPKGFSLTSDTNALVITQAGGVHLNTNSPNASAAFEVSSTSKGLLVPRMTTASRTAIPSPANGLLVYDTDLNNFYYYSTAWNALGGPSSASKYSSVGAASFTPVGNGSDDFQLSAGGSLAFFPTGTGTAELAASVPLSSGTTLETIKINYYDNSTANVTLNLFENGASIATQSSSGATAGEQSFEMNVNQALDFENNTYTIVVTFSDRGNGWTDLGIRNCRLKYAE